MEAELDALGEELELEEQEELDKHLLDVGPAVPSQLPEVSMTAARGEHDSCQSPEATKTAARGEHKAVRGYKNSCLRVG